MYFIENDGNGAIMWMYSIRYDEGLPNIVDIYCYSIRKFRFVLCYGYCHHSMKSKHPCEAEYNIYITWLGSYFAFDMSIPCFWFRFLFGIGRESLWLPRYDDFSFFERLCVMACILYAYIIHDRKKVYSILFNHYGV